MQLQADSDELLGPVAEMRQKGSEYISSHSVARVENQHSSIEIQVLFPLGTNRSGSITTSTVGQGARTSVC